MFKKWIYPSTDESETRHIAEKYGISETVAKVLQSRNFDFAKAHEYLGNEPIFHNPFLMKDMQKAADAVKKAVEDKVLTAVYGDYDVDGITSTYILYDYLTSLGANVIYYIPDRINEGYGVNTDAIDILSEKGVKLIITVDTGITAVKETEYAAKKGIDLIITDHHTLKDEIPHAVAAINPKIPSDYPFDALAGVGVAFKLVYAISGCDKEIFDKYCDIAAIGTIADMVPLTDENRYIVKYGINKLKTTSNVGLKALMSVCSLAPEALNSTNVSFVIAPRLNSAGRMAKADMSVELLLEKDLAKAIRAAENLNECNRMRQAEEQRILDESLDIIRQNSRENDDFILVAKKGWLHGVIGIVSSKLTERFHRPSAVISINPDGSGKASGRSINGINLFEALSNSKEYLVRYGGHELAAGFTVEKGMLDEFNRSMNEYCRRFLNEENATPTIKIDGIIAVKDINTDTINDLKLLEPYGMSNNAPIFCLEDVQIKSIRLTQNKKHAFILASDGTNMKEVPVFGKPELVAEFAEGDYVSMVGELNENNFRGITKAQFVVKDIHISKANNLIDRKILAEVFGAIKLKISEKAYTLSKNNPNPFGSYGGYPDFSREQIKNAVKIFDELCILNVEDAGNAIVISKGENFFSKTNLENSATYQKFGVSHT